MAGFFAFRTANFTCDLWDFTATTQQDGSVIRTYFESMTNKKFYLQPDGVGRLYCYFGDYAEPMEPRWQLRNLRDKSGKEVRTGGVWQLTNMEPVFNVFEIREGFSGNATLLYDGYNAFDMEGNI